MSALEAAVRFGALLGEELGRRRIAERQLAAQGTWRNGIFRDGLGGVHAQGLNDGAGRAMRLLALERLGAVEGVGRDAARLAAVVAWLRLEAVKAILLVLALPAGQRWPADGAAGGVGDLVIAGGDLLAQAALAAGLKLVAQQGQDERVPEQRNGGAALLGINTFGHSSTSWIGVGPSISAGQGPEKMQNCVGGGLSADRNGIRFGGQIACSGSGGAGERIRRAA